MRIYTPRPHKLRNRTILTTNVGYSSDLSLEQIINVRENCSKLQQTRRGNNRLERIWKFMTSLIKSFCLITTLLLKIYHYGIMVMACFMKFHFVIEKLVDKDLYLRNKLFIFLSLTCTTSFFSHMMFSSEHFLSFFLFGKIRNLSKLKVLLHQVKSYKNTLEEP
jgi:hypothetical protein